MTTIQRGLATSTLLSVASRYGCRMYFDHDFEKGVLKTFVIRPDGGKSLFVFKRWTKQRVKQVRDFMLPY